MKYRFLNYWKKDFFKKILLLVMGVIFLILVVYGFYRYMNIKKESVNSKGSSVVLIDDVVNRPTDSDADGVPDWEEILYGLDINNPDSDGDGVSDLDYIRQKKRDDEFDLNQSLGFSQNISESDRVGRGLYTALSALMNNGEITDENRDLVVNNVVDYISDINLAERTFISDDFNIVDNSKENSLAYKKKLATLTKKYPIKLSEFELILLAPSDPNAYGIDVQNANIKYKEYLDELLFFNVPSAISKQHIRLTNIIGQIAGSLDNISKGENDVDDIVTLSSLVQVEEIFNQTVTTLSDLSIYFDIVSDDSSFADEV